MTVETATPRTAEPLPETLRHVPALLGAEFGADVNGEVVKRTVAETYRQLASDARVSSFLPILTEKVARDRLADLTGHQRRNTVTRTLTA